MTGIVVLGHGRFAGGLVDAAQMIAGRQKGIAAVELSPQDTPESFKDKVEAAIAGVASGEDGILLLCDLLGGTPMNVAAFLAERHGYQCVAGANLPLILEVLMNRVGNSARDLAAIAVNAGHAGVVDVRLRLTEQQVE
ncbi:MAG: PTS sugar transporter subunit IIA [Firmicutes bacterium]|nr:PTS sugar transporter subunit IIA [Bacillota bacterium]